MTRCKSCDIEVVNGQFCPECGALCESDAMGKSIGAFLAIGHKLKGKYIIEEKLQTGAINRYIAASPADQKVLIKESVKKTHSANKSIVKEAKKNESTIIVGDTTPPLKAEFSLLRSLGPEGFHKVQDYFEESGKEYLVLEYPVGKTLSRILSEVRFEKSVAIALIINLCQAVARLHQKGYAHLDIAPDNVQISDNNKVKLLISGRYRKLGVSVENCLTTDSFSAPELYKGEQIIVDRKADIYSIGALLYTLLTKKAYLGGGPSEIFSNVHESEIARIILQSLAPNPESRYKTTDDLMQKLLSYEARSKMNLQFHTAVLSDLGMVRQNNEDCALVLNLSVWRESRIGSSSLYIVADGMGGEQAGEIASNKAIREISKAIWESLGDDSAVDYNELIQRAIQKANAAIYDQAKDNPSLSSMGTTVTLGLRIGQNLYIGHVGDSRAYLIRNRNIMQLTEDHSVVASLVKERVITSDEAKTHPDRGKIFRCLGNAPSVSVDKLKEGKLQLQAGDVLILCTDGLVSNVSDDELLSVVTKEAAAHESCSQLISLANERGGDDNITAIVIKVDITKLGG
jgi:protein phosphatase